MPRLRRPGLRVLFVLLIFLGIVPVTALMVKTAVDQRASARTRVAEEAARLARLAALRESDLIDGGREALATAGQIEEIRMGSSPGCASRLQALLPLYPRFANIGVVGPDATLLCSAHPSSSGALNFSDREWFQRAVRTRRFSVGDYQVGRITGQPSLVFGLPLIDRGEVQAVAWAALDLSWLQQFAASLDLPGKPVVTVFDRSGTVLARHPDPKRWTGTTATSFDEVLRAGSHTRDTVGFDGVQRVSAFTVLGSSDNPHAVIGVGIATEDAYAAASAALRRNLLVLAGLAVVGLLGARFAAERLILRPTRSLVAVSTSLASGDLASRVGPDYAVGELGEVSRAFDTMASALQVRDYELKEATEQRRRSQARFEALLEAGPDAIVGVDGDGLIRLVNRQAETLFGWSRDDLLGRHVETLAPRISEKLGLHFGAGASAACLDRLGGMLAVTGRRRSGSEFPAEITLAALETDEGLLVSAAVRDVTERRAAEQELLRSREQLQAILDNAPASIYMKDSDGRYVLVNRRFEEDSGVPRASAIGRTAPELFGPDAGAVRHQLDLDVLANLTPAKGEETVPVEDGDRSFLTIRFPLLDASGVPYAVCGISTDITERIRAQAQRDELEARLQQAQRLETVGQLAGGLAHDLNNRLAVILNYADFILDAASSTPPKDYEEIFAGIRSDAAGVRRASEGAAALIRQLLIFARRDVVQPRILRLDAVITDLEPLLRRTLGEDLTFELEFPPTLWPLHADPGRMEQLLMNLVMNARDAMEHGGTLAIKTGNQQLEPGAAEQLGIPPGPYVTLVVSDTGRGMPPDVAARAFEPFFTTKPKGHGSGLGLATVFGIVAEAQGNVTLESTPGHGTTVRVYLPAVIDEVPAPPVLTGAAGPAPVEATVLVVEDEDDVRDVTKRILAAAGYTVLAAADARAALRICESYDGPVDLVVTDVVMPGYSGPEMVELARPLRPGMQVIYMSGYPEDFLARRHGIVSQVELIGKPFTAETLLRTVEAALAGRE